MAKLKCQLEGHQTKDGAKTSWGACYGAVKEYHSSGRPAMLLVYCERHAYKYQKLCYGMLTEVSREAKPSGKYRKLRCDICKKLIKDNKDIGCVVRKNGIRVTECRTCHPRKYTKGMDYKRKHRALSWI